MSIKQRLYPTPGQVSVLRGYAGQNRWIWNRFLALRSARAHDTSREATGFFEPLITPRECSTMLAQLRKEYDWLGDGASAVQQQVLRNLQDAYTRHWSSPGQFGFPKFRKKGPGTDSIYLRDLKLRRLNRKWGETLVPKLGWVRFRITRLWSDITAAKSATITRTPGDTWHVVFTIADRPQFPRKSTGKSVGIDLGGTQTITAADSTGETVQVVIPGFTPGEQARFLALQRKLARQDKRSRRRAVTVRAMGVMTDRLKSRRYDWIEQHTTRLARAYDHIVLEDLNTAGMVKRPLPRPDLERPGEFLPNGAAAKSGLNKLIYASQWGRIRERLTDKTMRAGVTLTFINPAYTSQQCSVCGHTEKGNRESQAVFSCLTCGHTANADVNAAMNIRAVGCGEKSAGRPAMRQDDAVNGRESHALDRQPSALTAGVAR